jgi:putative peptidoglycan lipid II flippase
VGLLFDLGQARAVQSVQIASDTPGFSLELRAGDSRSEDLGALRRVVASDQVSGPQMGLKFEPSSARYWLVWITDLPSGGGGNAHIGEVQFLGR